MLRFPPLGDYAKLFLHAGHGAPAPSPPPSAAPTATPWGGFGAQVDANGQVVNGINPITGQPLGPNEGGSISGGYNPTTGQVYPVVPGSPVVSPPVAGPAPGPSFWPTAPYGTVGGMLGGAQAQPRQPLTAALQMPGVPS